MPRRATSTEPALGTDSFLDVTANLVGVLIVFIVLVGLRVRKMPETVAMDAAIDRRLTSLRSGVDNLTSERSRLEQELLELRQGLTAKQAALAGLNSSEAKLRTQEQAIGHAQQSAEELLRVREAELAEAQKRLVSLSKESVASTSPAAASRRLVHRSPLSQPLDLQELQLELLDSRVTFIDLAGLLERVRAKSRTLEADIRASGRATSDAGPVGPFRLRFTLARENLPFSQSLFYSSSSFNARVVEWQLIPVQDLRGEPVGEAVQPDSQLDRLLARNSPNKYAITLWTYSDSFSAFRQLRDHLSDRGYAVAARPLPLGIPIRGSAMGTRSVAQ